MQAVEDAIGPSEIAHHHVGLRCLDQLGARSVRGLLVRFEEIAFRRREIAEKKTHFAQRIKAVRVLGRQQFLILLECRAGACKIVICGGV